MESAGCQELQRKVIDKGLCTLCGGCVGICPYFIAYGGRVVLRDACDLAQGRCSLVCPRLSLDLDELSKTVLRVPYTWDEMGPTKRVLMARSTDPLIKTGAQDAGTVTAITIFALEEGIIDLAVLTLFEDKSLPKGVIVSTRDEALKCAGSSYIAAPTLEAFNRALQGDRRSRTDPS